jgi:L-rhamnose mutarotase
MKEEKKTNAFGMSLNLKDDPQVIEKYKEYHRHVWPEVEQTLKSVGTRLRTPKMGYLEL